MSSFSVKFLSRLEIIYLLLLFVRSVLCDHRGYFVLKVSSAYTDESSPFAGRSPYIATAPNRPSQPINVERQPRVNACPGKPSAVYDPTSIWLADWRLPSSFNTDPASGEFLERAKLHVENVITPLVRSLSARTRTFALAITHSAVQLEFVPDTATDISKSSKFQVVNINKDETAERNLVDLNSPKIINFNFLQDLHNPDSEEINTLDVDLTPESGSELLGNWLESRNGDQKLKLARSYFSACEDDNGDWRIYARRKSRSCFAVSIRAERVPDDKICFRWNLGEERTAKDIPGVNAKKLRALYHGPDTIVKDIDQNLLPKLPSKRIPSSVGSIISSPWEMSQQTDRLLSTINQIENDNRSFADGLRDFVSLERSTPAFPSVDTVESQDLEAVDQFRGNSDRKPKAGAHGDEMSRPLSLAPPMNTDTQPDSNLGVTTERIRDTDGEIPETRHGWRSKKFQVPRLNLAKELQSTPNFGYGNLIYQNPQTPSKGRQSLARARLQGSHRRMTSGLDGPVIPRASHGVDMGLAPDSRRQSVPVIEGLRSKDSTGYRDIPGFSNLFPPVKRPRILKMNTDSPGLRPGNQVLNRGGNVEAFTLNSPGFKTSTEFDIKNRPRISTKGADAGIGSSRPYGSKALSMSPSDALTNTGNRFLLQRPQDRTPRYPEIQISQRTSFPVTTKERITQDKTAPPDIFSNPIPNVNTRTRSKPVMGLQMSKDGRYLNGRNDLVGIGRDTINRIRPPSVSEPKLGSRKHPAITFPNIVNPSSNVQAASRELESADIGTQGTRKS